MKNIQFIIFFIFCCLYGHSQIDEAEYNLGFERLDVKRNLPKYWLDCGSNGYNYVLDSIVKKEGKYSLRIQSTKTSPNLFNSCLAYIIPCDSMLQRIELKFFYKIDKPNISELKVIVSAMNGQTAIDFNSFKKDNIQNSIDWTEASISLSNLHHLDKIHLFIKYQGEGKLWIDELKVLINDQDINNSDLFLANKDREFDNSSNISSISPRDASNLSLLCKVWGFLKYYHPSVRKGNYNWDYELFRILPKISECKTLSDRNQILYNWIDSMGSTEVEERHLIDSSLVNIYPDLNWIKDTVTLGSKLSHQLANISRSKKLNQHYYIGLAPSIENPIFKHENLYEKMNYSDVGFRMLCLFKYWNIIKYYYPYINLFKNDWDNVLTNYIPKFINSSDELSYKLTTLSLIGEIEDSHANMENDPIIKKYKGVNILPVNVDFVENEIVIDEIIENKYVKTNPFKVGDIITKINGVEIKNIIEEKMKYVTASNYPTKLRNVKRDILRTSDTVLCVNVIRNKKTETINTKSYKINYTQRKRDTCFKYLTPEIAYINPGNIKIEYLKNAMPKFLTAKGIVIDLRYYPSEFILYHLCKYLLDEPKDFAKVTKGSIVYPGLFLFKPVLAKVGVKNNNYFKGKVIVIVNEHTQSQGEFTAMALKTVTNCIVIGSTTAGADGNVSEINLPGNIKTKISGTGIYYPNGVNTQRIGIIPDIEVHRTIKGITRGQDELIEKAIYLIAN